MSLKDQITEDMKTAMRAGDKPNLGVIRMLLAEIKQREVDDRIEALDDTQVLAVLGKMVKQRKESLRQYQDAGRTDLADQESFEIGRLQQYLPQQLSDDEVDAVIEACLAESGASSMRDMGKVMGLVKSKVQGRADMGQVSAKIKRHLSS